MIAQYFEKRNVNNNNNEMNGVTMLQEIENNSGIEMDMIVLQYSQNNVMLFYFHRI